MIARCQKTVHHSLLCTGLHSNTMARVTVRGQKCLQWALFQTKLQPFMAKVFPKGSGFFNRIFQF